MNTGRLAGTPALSLLVALCIAPMADAATVRVLDQAPQFSIYGSGLPANYTAPPGIVFLFDHDNATWYTLAKLGRAQKRQLGRNLQAQVGYQGGCDAFDRIESVAYIAMPPGVQPTLDDADAAVELGRFMTPFNTYDSAHPAYAFPAMGISRFASQLADPTRDIWIGIKGGSYPTYSNSPGTFNPCWDSSGHMVPTIPGAPYPPGLPTDQAQVIFANTGFYFSLDLVSSGPAAASTGPAIAAVMGTPVFPQGGSSPYIPGLIDVPDPGDGSHAVSGTLQVVLTTHGNTEYGYFSGNTLLVNGVQAGSAFSTKADCKSFVGATINPWNPTINTGTTGQFPSNPRNWCPAGPVRTTVANPGVPNPTPGNAGTPVQATIIRNVTLDVGTNTLQLNLGDFVTRFGGTDGSYPTSITFIPD